MGDIDKSKKLSQECLYSNITELQTAIVGLSRTTVNEKDFLYALELADINNNINKIFKIPCLMYQTNYILFADIYTKMEDENMTLTYFEKIVENKNNLISDIDLSKIKFFDKLETSDIIKPDEYMDKLVRSIVEDSSYDFVKHTNRYKELLNKI